MTLSQPTDPSQGRRSAAGHSRGMSEPDANAQRHPDPGPDSPQPTVELPRVEREHPPVAAPDAPATTGSSGAVGPPQSPARPEAGADLPARPEDETISSARPEAAAPAPAASPWAPPAPRPQEWSGAGAPGPGQPVYPAPPLQPGGPAGPMPPWSYPVGAPAPRRPNRVGKAAAAGAAALVLMLGSGLAGGLVTLAVTDEGGTTRTYTAAPIVNSADLPAIAATVQDSVVSINTGDGEGSGVVLSADGYVLTNNHVVATAGGDTVNVVFANGESARARIVGTDPKTDLAVVKAEGVSGRQPATLGDSDAMRVGDTVLALGSPLGLQGSVTAGIISARDRTIQAGEGNSRTGGTSISGLLQTDAPINPGNSGGALVNTRGEVIGINTAIATAGQGNGNIGVGFAIPSNKAKQVADALQKGQKISHPFLGVSVTRSTDGGALVSGVTPGSPAEKAGLREGDVITEFGGETIADSDALVAAVQAGKVGDKVEITYQRNGTENQATVTLAEAS
jgi:putative serine protease PepD